MKKLSLAITFGISLAFSASAQVKPNLTNNHPSLAKPSAVLPAATGTRARVVQPRANTSNQSSIGNQSTSSGSASVQWGNVPFTNSVSSATAASVSRTATVTPVVTAALTQTYRVGVGDILDIQIPDSLSTRSTLYTVTADGIIDYPLATGPLQVAGLTPEGIAARLRANIRVIDAAPIMVKVRDFASHTVNVIGFVQTPGAKVLRREAVPLYVVMAEAAALKEATSVTVVRNAQIIAQVDLRNIAAANQLILPGDTIKVSDRALGAR